VAGLGGVGGVLSFILPDDSWVGALCSPEEDQGSFTRTSEGDTGRLSKTVELAEQIQDSQRGGA